MLNCQHFNFYEQDKFRAQLSWHGKSFITSEPGVCDVAYRMYFENLNEIVNNYPTTSKGPLALW